jgi:glycosyltransferase involved in cell wall biosynthesis
MKTVAFYIAHYDFRGTGNAVFNYAYYNEKILNNRSIILYKKPDLFPYFNHPLVYELFSKHLTILNFSNKDEIEEICNQNNIDYIYFLCSGQDSRPPILDYFPPKVKTIGHFVFDTISNGSFDIQGTISETISKNTGLPYVYHIIDLPSSTTNLRKELSIPENAVVFGRHGGFETFDIPYVFEAIIEVLNKNENIYFIFAPHPRYFQPVHPRIKYLDVIVDLNQKRKFIDTCDAMIHARTGGESFGISVLEFVFCGKPVFTTTGFDNQHITNLGEAKIQYENKEDLIQKMLEFSNSTLNEKQKEKEVNEFENVVAKFSPYNVMKNFEKTFLK